MDKGLSHNGSQGLGGRCRAAVVCSLIRNSANFPVGLTMQFSVSVVGKQKLRRSCVDQDASLDTLGYFTIRKGCVGLHNL